MTLTLTSAVEVGQTVLLSYTDAVGDTVAATQDAAGNDAASFVNMTVSNSTPRAHIAETPTNLIALGNASLDAAGHITTQTESATIQQVRTLMAAENNGTTTIHSVNVSAADAATLAPDANDAITLVDVTGVFRYRQRCRNFAGRISSTRQISRSRVVVLTRLSISLNARAPMVLPEVF